jgi:hypothetical protein
MHCFVLQVRNGAQGLRTCDLEHANLNLTPPFLSVWQDAARKVQAPLQVVSSLDTFTPEGGQVL